MDTIYVLITDFGHVTVTKFLIKLSEITGISRQTLSKKLYKDKTIVGDGWTIYTADEVNIKARSRGNSGNFRGSEW